MNNKDWFRTAGFGMMIHWGLYALPAGEWKGKRMPYIGEWAQSYFRIPNEEYHQLAKAFQPICFRAEEWVKLAKEAGMQYLVVTTKHHDGFALFSSKTDDFNTVKATPFGRDVIAELAEACQKHGVRLGLYYSQDLDWSHPDGGGYLEKRLNCGEMSWTNDWDFPNASQKNYDRYFEEKALPQVEELLKGYGDLLLFWFDTPQTISEKQSRRLFELVKHYQPDCLVNSRIGNGMGDYRSLGDNEIPETVQSDGLYETPATLNDTWGYKSFDNHWKSAEEVLRLRKHLSQCNVNYLLNIGPDALGRFPAPAVQVLRKLKQYEIVK